MKSIIKILLNLHKDLITRIVIFDVILGLLGGIFLSTPLNYFSLSINNLAFLILIFLSSTSYQLYLLKQYTGGPSFYIIIPIKKIILLPFFIFNALLPLIFSLILFALSNLLFQFNFNYQEFSFVQKCFYLISFLTILKIIPIPIMILYKKHIMLIPGSFLILSILYLFISIITEILSSMIPLPTFATGIVFIISITVISFQLIKSAKIS